MSEKPSSVYANVVQVSRTPWDVNLHFLHAVVPRDIPPGEIEISSLSETVAVVTLPVAVADKLVSILRGVVDINVVEMEKSDARNG